MRFLLPFASLGALAFVLGASSALAQTASYIQISAGTGFVINRDGDIVTNAHVVNACKSITVRTDAGEIPATLLASDAKQDLAVLHVDDSTTQVVAPMRWNVSELRVGDPVVVMGYPGQDGIKGLYHYRKTTVTSLVGPTGESKWIQLASVAEHGNSGGPVLDTTGNVIAVISGLAMTYHVDKNGQNPPQLVGQSDVAITLAALQDFLHSNRIAFYESESSNGGYADTVIEANAHQFILPVHCVQEAVEAPAAR